MMVWSCVDHDGHWPVGVASVVVAESEEQARRLLRLALNERGLAGDEPFTLRPVDLSLPNAHVLNDGEY